MRETKMKKLTVGNRGIPFDAIRGMVPDHCDTKRKRHHFFRMCGRLSGLVTVAHINNIRR